MWKSVQSQFYFILILLTIGYIFLFVFIASPLVQRNLPHIKEVKHIKQHKTHNIPRVVSSVAPTSVRISVETYLEMWNKSCKVQEKATSPLPPCPCIPSTLKGPLTVNKNLNTTWDEINSSVKNVASGGRWRPSTCQSRSRVAVVVPYRDREPHLKLFLSHMHPILQRQLLDYQIFVVEQEFPAIFNKATMLNAAFLEIAKSNQTWDCIVIHDVDVYMEDDRNMIHCRQQSHVSLVSALDRWHYRTIYEKVFGGAVAITPEMMLKANGYSNNYFGWGGEDDNFEMRLEMSNYTLWRPPKSVARYTTLKHQRDSTNKNQRQYSAKVIKSKKDTNGLNSLIYDVVAKEDRPLYTWFHIRLNATDLPYPDHDRYTYTAQSGQCSSSVALAQLALSRVSCQYSCDQNQKCSGYTYILDPDSKHCVLLKDVCEHMDPAISPDTLTYGKGKREHEGYHGDGFLTIVAAINKLSSGDLDRYLGNMAQYNQQHRNRK